MTTNYLGTLDPTLVQPGRIDLRADFTLSIHRQISDMYKCIYTTKLDARYKEKLEHYKVSSNSSLEKAAIVQPKKLEQIA